MTVKDLLDLIDKETTISVWDRTGNVDYGTYSKERNNLPAWLNYAPVVKVGTGYDSINVVVGNLRGDFIDNGYRVTVVGFDFEKTDGFFSHYEPTMAIIEDGDKMTRVKLYDDLNDMYFRYHGKKHRISDLVKW